LNADWRDIFSSDKADDAALPAQGKEYNAVRWKNSRQDVSIFSWRSDNKDGRCVYFADRNIALCPTGQVLYPGFFQSIQ
jgi:hypothetical protein